MSREYAEYQDEAVAPPAAVPMWIMSAKHGVSERLACRVLGQHRSTQRDDEAALTAAIIAFATEYGRYGYRRIAAMLRDTGWVVNIKRVERIWRGRG